MTPPATQRQLEACKRIAERTGRTFAFPLTKAEAHKIISGTIRRCARCGDRARAGSAFCRPCSRERGERARPT